MKFKGFYQYIGSEYTRKLPHMWRKLSVHQKTKEERRLEYLQNLKQGRPIRNGGGSGYRPLNKLDIYKSIGSDGMQPWVLREFCDAIVYLWKVLVIQRGSWKLEESKCHSCLQEGQEGRSEELQAGEPHLNPWVGNGATNAGKHFQTHERQEGDGELSAWIYKGEVSLTNLITLCNEVSNEGRAVNVAYLD